MYTYSEFPLSSANSPDGSMLSVVESMNEYHLSSLLEAVHIRYNQIMANKLQHYGLNVEVKNPYHDDQDIWYYFIAIEDPSIRNRFVHATYEQCKNLLDRLVNLNYKESFKRWEEKMQFSNDYITIREEDYAR